MGRSPSCWPLPASILHDVRKASKFFGDRERPATPCRVETTNGEKWERWEKKRTQANRCGGRKSAIPTRIYANSADGGGLVPSRPPAVGPGALAWHRPPAQSLRAIDRIDTR